ncbi:unnamed protein product [Rotaria sp. Silwood2]|nr:unnamed protein product [Rotaria sp. Silwood2]CAF3358705.1 unnamed protein product [Rotaria sp. Silwood2]CAF4017315.1 unnamed protein product [Rotaria sp. Silwood2]CAF4126808.1 unnamed protein product [Rotaria sp. Silwood2]CAF4571703.1 unnamed protein product [Rotaria sp. Silwood2]
MSGDKRKRASLDSFVTVTKKTIVTPSSSEQTEIDQSELNTLEVAEIIDDDTHENDIGFQLSLRTTLTNETKHRLLTKPFRPDNKYKFPNQQEKGEPVRRFMASWLDQHSFLVYSPYYEGAYCSACALFSPKASSQSDVLFVNYPSSQFRHLKYFSKYIKNHLSSKNHKLAMVRATEFIRTFENPSSSIDYQLDRNRIEVIEKNKSILLSIIKVVITCARENIALRGHRGEDITSIRDHLTTVETPSGSNFISLLKQRIEAGDQLLQSHLENANRNSTYSSSSIQNEIIELIHEHILSAILGRLGPTTLYSIIVDGTTDSANIEQLCFLIRYVDADSFEIHEDFLAFIPTTSSTGEFFEQAKEIAKELFVQPTAPRTYQRRHGQHILDPEEFYRDQVFLPFLRELKTNVD